MLVSHCLTRLWHDIDEYMNFQRTKDIVKSIRRNVSRAAPIEAKPSDSLESSLPAGRMGPEEVGVPGPIMAELDARFTKAETRFNQLESHLDRVEAHLQRIEALLRREIKSTVEAPIDGDSTCVLT